MAVIWFVILKNLRNVFAQSVALAFSITFFMMPMVKLPFRWQTWILVWGLLIFATLAIYWLRPIQRIGKKENWLAGIFGLTFLAQIGFHAKLLRPMKWNGEKLSSLKKSVKRGAPVFHIILDTASSRSSVVNEFFLGSDAFTLYPRAATGYGQTIYSLRSLLENAEPNESEDLKRHYSDFARSYLREISSSHEIVTNLSSLIKKLPSGTTHFDLAYQGVSTMSMGEVIIADVLNYFIALKFVYLPTPPWEYFLNTIPYRGFLELNGLAGIEQVINRHDVPGKYFLIYLFSPHPPAFINKNCKFSYLPDHKGYDSHFSCALKKVGEFVNRLKREGVFEESLIIIHGDHGRSNQDKDRHLPLLLIKYPFQKEVKTDESAILLSDLGRIVLDEVGPGRKLPWKGLNPRNKTDVAEMNNRKRMYFFYFNNNPEIGFGKWMISPDLTLVPTKAHK